MIASAAMTERSDLVAVFMVELGLPHGAAEANLEGELRGACARGRSAFPQVALDDLTFVRHLARVLKREERSGLEVSKLAIEDLFLACACAVTDGRAAQIFRARFGVAVAGSMSGLVPPADADDVREQFLQDLLVGRPDAPPKIAAYSGRSSLDKWVGVAARRAALMWLRRSRTELRARRAAASDPAANDEPGFESRYMKERYRGEFERALREALGRLPERDRVVLRLCLMNAVSLDRIGAMYKVSQSTISRWLAAARRTLLDDVKETLRVRFGTTSSAELASLARMVASRLDLTLASFLKSQP